MDGSFDLARKEALRMPWGSQFGASSGWSSLEDSLKSYYTPPPAPPPVDIHECHYGYPHRTYFTTGSKQLSWKEHFNIYTYALDSYYCQKRAKTRLYMVFNERAATLGLYVVTDQMGFFEKAALEAEKVRDWERFAGWWITGGEEEWERDTDGGRRSANWGGQGPTSPSSGSGGGGGGGPPPPGPGPGGPPSSSKRPSPGPTSGGAPPPSPRHQPLGGHPKPNSSQPGSKRKPSSTPEPPKSSQKRAPRSGLGRFQATAEPSEEAKPTPPPTPATPGFKGQNQPSTQAAKGQSQAQSTSHPTSAAQKPQNQQGEQNSQQPYKPTPIQINKVKQEAGVAEKTPDSYLRPSEQEQKRARSKSRTRSGDEENPDWQRDYYELGVQQGNKNVVKYHSSERQEAGDRKGTKSQGIRIVERSIPDLSSDALTQETSAEDLEKARKKQEVDEWMREREERKRQREAQDKADNEELQRRLRGNAGRFGGQTPVQTTGTTTAPSNVLDKSTAPTQQQTTGTETATSQPAQRKRIRFDLQDLMLQQAQEQLKDGQGGQSRGKGKEKAKEEVDARTSTQTSGSTQIQPAPSPASPPTPSSNYQSPSAEDGEDEEL